MMIEGVGVGGLVVLYFKFIFYVFFIVYVIFFLWKKLDWVVL